MARTPKPKTALQLAGAEAEQVAADLLVLKGYQILQRNYRAGRHEIDLIANLGQLVVFIEVKFRADNGLGYPEEMVSQTQIKSVHKAALVYLDSVAHIGPVRYDIIAITGYDLAQTIVHLEDAF
jgi:putative endonuclease